MNLPPIPNAFENVKNACEQRLTELYPAGIPDQVLQRYHQELSYLQESDMVADFEVFRQLCEESRKCAQIFFTTATCSSSILTYLLKESLFNPMPAHYYCSHCGYYESVDANVVGLDLPNKSCPLCGLTLRADGFDLPAISFWGLNRKKGYFDYLVSPCFFPFAKRRLQKIYPEHLIVPLATTWIYQNVDSNFSTHCCGFCILPENTTLNDYSELVGYLPSGECCLSYDRQMTSLIPKIVMNPHKDVHFLLQLQQKTGLYCMDISPDDLHPLSYYDFINTSLLEHNADSLLDASTPKNYREVISFIAATLNSYKSDDNSDHHHAAFELCSPYSRRNKTHICYTREDVHEKLIELGYDHNTAFELAEMIRKGKQLNASLSRKEDQALKDELENSPSIPEDLKAYFFDCMYLSSRSYVTERVIMTAMLAYYQKQDSKIYAETVLQK